MKVKNTQITNKLIETDEEIQDLGIKLDKERNDYQKTSFTLTPFEKQFSYQHICEERERIAEEERERIAEEERERIAEEERERIIFLH